MTNEGTAEERTGKPRHGQSAYNALWAWRPDIARLITGTDADPYYNDDNLPAFHRRVVELLNENGSDRTTGPADPRKQAVEKEKETESLEELRRYAEGLSHHGPDRWQIRELLERWNEAAGTLHQVGEALTLIVGEGGRHWPRENRLDGTADRLDEAAEAYETWLRENPPKHP